MSETPNVVDVVVIGSGCAGHTAAIYAARANLSPLVFEGPESGGQLSLTTIVENYPGFPDGVDGYELMQAMKKQAMRFGAEYIMETVDNIDLSQRPFTLTAANRTYQAKTVVIASGARARLLGVPGEREFFAKGVHTCATCDGAFYRGKKIVVVGGGDTAMEDSMFLTRFVEELHLVHRRDKLRASQIMQQRVLNNPKVHIHWNSSVIEMYGKEGKFAGVKLQKKHSDGQAETAEFPCDGMFLAIGHIPNVEFLKGQVDTNSEGYLKTVRQDDKCVTCDVWTNVPGVFAAGDVVDYHFQQAITAAAMGCKAAMAAEEFLGMEE